MHSAGGQCQQKVMSGRTAEGRTTLHLSCVDLHVIPLFSAIHPEPLSASDRFL